MRDCAAIVFPDTYAQRGGVCTHNSGKLNQTKGLFMGFSILLRNNWAKSHLAAGQCVSEGRTYTHSAQWL